MQLRTQLYGAVIKVLLSFYAAIPASDANNEIVIDRTGNVKYEVLEGAPYTLTCSCKLRNPSGTDQTILKITWQHNNTDIEPTLRRHAVSTSNGYISHLQFQYVDRFLDEGEYTCEINNITIGSTGGSAVKNKLYLHVIWVEIPEVVVVNRTAETVTLNCKFNDWSNGQMISIQWLHNLLPAPGHVDRTTSKNFVIEDASAIEKSGTYHCLVTASVHLPEDSPGLRGAIPQKKNSLLSSNSFTLVANNSRGFIPRFDSDMYAPMRFVEPRRPFQLECPFALDSSKDGSGEVIWTEMSSAPCETDKIIKARATPDATPYKVRVEPGRASVLEVHEYRSSDCGDLMNYWCSYSTGEVDMAEPKFVFSVRPVAVQVPRILYLVATPSSYFAYDDGVKDFEKAKLCLTAVVKPTINTIYQWYLPSTNGRADLASGPSFENSVRPNGNVQLCIRGKNFPVGKYTLQARNAYGNASAQIEIGRWSPPQFLSYVIEHERKETFDKEGQLITVTVKEGGSVELRCNVHAPPYPITSLFWRWSRNRASHKLSYNMTGIAVNERSGLLKLSNISTDWAGSYSCIGITLFTDVLTTMPTMSINVLRSTKVLSASAVLSGKTLQLECVIEGDYWDENSSVNLTTELRNVLATRVESRDAHTRIARVQVPVSALPSKSYWCIAKSGSETATKLFSIENRPKISVKPENASAIDGESAYLHCQPDFSDYWLVSWSSVRTGAFVPSCESTGNAYEPCVLVNGSLRFASVRLDDAGWWNCFMSLKVSDKQSSIEPESFGSVYLTVIDRVTDAGSISRTVTIVIVSALAYLGLVMVVTFWFSMRLMKKRKRRPRTGDAAQMQTLLGAQNTRPNFQPARPLAPTDDKQRIRAGSGNGLLNGETGNQQLSVAYPNGTPSSSGSYPNQLPNSNPNGLSAAQSPITYSAVPVHPSSPNSTGSLPPIGSKQSGSTPGLLTPPSNIVYPQNVMPMHGWPIQDIRSSLTRGSCSTCDALSAGGLPVYCTQHSIGLSPAIVSEQPQSVLSHQTNITSVSQQNYPRINPMMQHRSHPLGYQHPVPLSHPHPHPHQPVTTTPASRSRCSNDSIRPVSRNQLQIIGRIGTGQFGEVLFGRMSLLNQNASIPVAIKTLLKLDEDGHRNFEREKDLFLGIQHDFVTELFGMCVEEEEPLLLVFEYPEWGTLKHFLLAVRADHERILQTIVDGSSIDEQSPPLPPLSLEQKIMMCLHVTAGMDFLANHGRVHTDLACRNLLLAPNLSVKVGLIGAYDVFNNEYYHVPYSASASLNNTKGRSKPVPLRWLAPECVTYEIRVSHEYESTGSLCVTSMLSEGSVYTPASDVWSFAMAAFEIFTYGELPFSTFSDEQVIESLKKADKTDKNKSWIMDYATYHTLRFASLQVSQLQQVNVNMGNMLPDPCFNDFSCSPPGLRAILEQCLRTDAHHRPTFAEVSVAFGEQLADSKQ